jgi:hypothetical protein
MNEGKLPKVADLFCGVGGASSGLHRAGLQVVGFDIEPQPNYPFRFVQQDAMTVDLSEFDAVWASPPCQKYSVMTRSQERHRDLYAPTRKKLIDSGKPYIIENVVGAPYQSGIVLCGSMFDLPVRRHRNFETSWMMFRKYCSHDPNVRAITVTGDSGGNFRHSHKGEKRLWPEYMGIPWGTPDEVTQAIPPPYAEYLGRELVKWLKNKEMVSLAI